jgi:hypothetical protein
MSSSTRFVSGVDSHQGSPFDLVEQVGKHIAHAATQELRSFLERVGQVLVEEATYTLAHGRKLEVRAHISSHLDMLWDFNNSITSMVVTLTLLEPPCFTREATYS